MFRQAVSQESGTSSWINARVANATRSPLAIILIGCTVFVASLVVLIVIPRQARRAQAPPPIVVERPDTIGLAQSAERLQFAVDSVSAEISAAADSLAAARAATRDTLPIELRARRDSLAATVTTLNRLLARVQNAPLPASYRALAEAPTLRGKSRVTALVDTLTAVEREREDFGASGGVDPIFVALTERATTIGRAIVEMAERERTMARTELAALRQLQPRRDTLPASIFIALATAQRDSIEEELIAAEDTLVAARRIHAASDSVIASQRKAANTTVPPVAMLIASALLGIVAGFAGALGRELRHPRIATVDEAERTSGVRVLAVIESTSRTVDDDPREHELPPLIDVGAESYRRLYLHLTGARATLAMVTITGDDENIIGVVSANVAASAGREGRGTLLVDSDLAHSTVAAILGAANAPGLADIANGGASWPEALQAVTLGRDFGLDVIASGRRGSGDVTDQEADRIRRDLARMARRYDVMVLNASLLHVLRGARSVLPAPDLLLCVRLGHTRLRALGDMIKSLRAAGTRVIGLVLWNADEPRIPAARPTSDWRRRGAADASLTPAS
jgi:hypothetical protein